MHMKRWVRSTPPRRANRLTTRNSLARAEVCHPTSAALTAAVAAAAAPRRVPGGPSTSAIRDTRVPSWGHIFQNKQTIDA